MTSSTYTISDAIHRNETVSSITLTNAGTNYENPIVTVDPPTLGITCTAIARSQGPVNSITLTDGGGNYTSTPTVDISGDGTGATATAIMGGLVTDATVTSGGSGYGTNSFTVTFTGGGGTGAKGIALTSIGGTVVGVTMTNPGSGYSSNPSIDFSNGTGTGAVGFGSIRTDTVVDITLNNGGINYESDLIFVTFSGGGGAGATAFATVQGPIESPITVTNGGSGYTSVPSVTITDNTGPGSGATATAVIEDIGVNENILDSDVVITNDMVNPGGGGILRVYFSFQIALEANSTISVFNNDTFKGNLNADNSSEVVDSGCYRFDLDVESGDSLNFKSNKAIDSVDFFRTHLVQFGA